MVRFTVKGQPISVNLCYRKSRNGMIFMSREGKAWKALVTLCSKVAMNGSPPAEGPLVVKIAFFYQSRRNDLDGGLKPTLDALAPFVMKNDRQVEEIHLWTKLDPANPRAEITVELR